MLTRKVAWSIVGAIASILTVSLVKALFVHKQLDYSDTCGALPTEEDNNIYITNWWKCAFDVAVTNGVCIAENNWNGWHYKVRQVISEVEGAYPYWEPRSYERDGDYIKIWMADPEIYIGRFKWAC